MTNDYRSHLTTRIIASSRRPANLGAVPEGAVSLAMGEPFADTPEAVVDTAVMSLQRGRTRYAPQTGEPALRRALAERLSHAHGVEIEEDQVILTHGASAGIAAMMLALVNPGDRIVLPEPTYSLYADHVAMAGGTVTWVANRPDGRLDLEALAEAIPGAKAVIVCTPSNPTGRIIPRADLEALQALTDAAGTVLVSDEAYADIVFDGVEAASVLNLRLVVDSICVGTFSKSYAMTGWRLGFIVAPTSIAADINRIHRTINGSLNTFVQDAAVTALALPDAYFDQMTAEYEKRRDLVVDTLSSVPFLTLEKPEGAFYAFPRIDSARSSAELTELLADRGGVLVRAGSEYGPSGEGHLRLSFATDVTTLTEGLERFVRTLAGIVQDDEEASEYVATADQKGALP